MNCRHVILFASCLLLTACSATGPGSRSPQSRPGLVMDERLRGRIATLNTAGQFVVVDFNVGAIPPLSSRMNVYRDNTVVGVIQLTGPVRDNLVAADILSGEVAVGDEAIWDRAKAGSSEPQEP
jgi:hypothetical protein